MERRLRTASVARVKFGVVQFPGSCDDRDAMRAAGLVAEAEVLWHAERDLRGVDAVIVPGGFSYGDYLRAGAIARFAPVMESVIDWARERGARAWHLQRLPGPVRGTAAAGGALAERQSCASSCREVQLEVVNPWTPFTGAWPDAGRYDGDPRETFMGALLRRRRDARARSRSAARSCCATGRVRTSTAR